ncbi:MAG: hypothetical protein JWO86_8480, partial [Myxococcaceae bacterium]|nr:hypothetical protein [Myxococcaceae bacterium]
MRFLVCTLPFVFCAAACADATEGTIAPRTPANGGAASTTNDVARNSELDLETVGCSTTAPVRRAPPEFDDADPSAVRLFFDVLAPYGAWVEDSRLGLVWMPAREGVGAAFVPYATQGRWTHRAFESAGNAPVDEYVWVSDLPWGWVTFHYGRWTYAGERGWAWVPGRRYAGAWVDWRAPERTGDPSGSARVVGWGPTPPSILWRVSPGPAASRARALKGDGEPAKLDVRDARLVAVPYAAFATPYAYVRARELFASNIGERLLYGPAALAVAHGTQSSNAPRPELLGFKSGEVPAPPTLDRGLQQAWMLA